MATSTERVRAFRQRQRDAIGPVAVPPVRDADELQALRATPASRAAAKPKPPERPGPNRVAQLRAAHMETVARRQGRAGKG
jgi:hypothetical protein